MRKSHCLAQEKSLWERVLGNWELKAELYATCLSPSQHDAGVSG